MIDAHFHIWSLERPECAWPTAADGVLHRDYGIEEYEAVARPLGVSGAVLVQTQESGADTEWLLDSAAHQPFVKAVVGWADIARADMAALAVKPKLAGLRPMVQHRAADWYDDPARAAGFAAMAEHGLSLDALVRGEHLPSLDRLAQCHSDLAIVIDHAAKPVFAADGLEAWRTAIAPLAERPNVWCKLSGLLTELGDRPAESLQPVVETILDLFGPDRVMWGSDWPVLTAVSDYESWLGLARNLVPEAHREAVFAGNAARFYRIEQGALQ